MDNDTFTLVFVLACLTQGTVLWVTTLMDKQKTQADIVVHGIIASAFWLLAGYALTF